MIKFLIIRFSSIGDIVLTTPVIRCLKNQVEQAEVYYLTKRKYATVLDGNPYLTKVYTLDKNASSVISELRKENFNYIIDLHHNLRTRIFKAALLKKSFSFKKLNLRKWIMVNSGLNILPDKHIVERYLDTLRAFSVSPDKLGLDYFIPGEVERNSSRTLGGDLNPYVALVVGGGHNTKQIPVDKIVEIIAQLDCRIILLGGPEDKEKAELICSQTYAGKLINKVGDLTLHESAFVIKHAHSVITGDTGLMHIAAAFKKDIVSVWGNTIPEFGMYPYSPGEASALFEVKNLKCRPCSKIGYSSCPKKHFRCMIDQDYKEIVNFTREILKEQNR